MRLTFLLLLLCATLPLAHAQFVCFSDSAAIYELPGTALPGMQGEACFTTGVYDVIVGGVMSDPVTPDIDGVYNCNILIVDHAAGKTYALPLDHFPPFVAEQFSATRYCFAMDQDTAYVLGGYGYDLAEGYETTFPMLTIFPLQTLIDSVVQQKNFMHLFELVIDPRLAIIDGRLIHIGTDFLIFGGRNIETKQDNFAAGIHTNEIDYNGQLRRFSLRNGNCRRELNMFQICAKQDVFFQCMPAISDPETINIDLKQK